MLSISKAKEQRDVRMCKEISEISLFSLFQAYKKYKLFSWRTRWCNTSTVLFIKRLLAIANLTYPNIKNQCLFICKLYHRLIYNSNRLLPPPSSLLAGSVAGRIQAFPLLDISESFAKPNPYHCTDSIASIWRQPYSYSVPSPHILFKIPALFLPRSTHWAKQMCKIIYWHQQLTLNKALHFSERP